MTAFVVASVRVKDADKFAEYGKLAGASMQPFGGEVAIRGKVSETLTGSADHAMSAVIKFPDIAAAKSWYASDAYQQIIPLREEASDMSLVLHEVPS